MADATTDASLNGREPPGLLDSALSYAHRNWAVFPVHEPDEEGRCSCGRSDCTHPGKHPRTQHGFKDASTREQDIRAWWQQWPRANIGIATGQVSGLFVLDLDPRNGSGESIARLGDLPRTPTTITGSGGRHILFKCPVPSVGSRSNALPGIDVKCQGGYVIAPPSLHSSGGAYSWLIGAQEELAEVPENVLRELRVTSRPSSSDKILEGSRNDTLFKYACSMRARGASTQDIASALHAANEERCVPPLPREEVEKIAQSAGSYPGPGAAEELDLLKLVLTNLSFGRLLLSRHGADLRHCHQWGRWLTWDGSRWREDWEAQVQQWATETQEWLRQLVEEELQEVRSEGEEGGDGHD